MWKSKKIIWNLYKCINVLYIYIGRFQNKPEQNWIKAQENTFINGVVDKNFTTQGFSKWILVF